MLDIDVSAQVNQRYKVQLRGQMHLSLSKLYYSFYITVKLTRIVLLIFKTEEYILFSVF